MSPKTLALAVFVLSFTLLASAAPPSAKWIWSDANDPAPKNRFTWFRKVVELDAIPEDATLHFAADSNGWLWINGRIVRRKVARYYEDRITAEVIDARPYLRRGKNVVVVRHHNWGPITTFQRSGNQHAGLYLDASWNRTDATWRWMTDPSIAQHEKQIVGVIGDPRIRYPVIMDAGKALGDAVHNPDFNDSRWSNAVVVESGPWPAKPRPVETPGQREYAVRPLHVLAAGHIDDRPALSDDPFSMAEAIRAATYRPDDALTQQVSAVIDGDAVGLYGADGATLYCTFDFYRPVHGYPYLVLDDASKGVVIDLGYCELAYAQYDGAVHVRTDGWINPEGVVGKGYADRYITASGRQSMQMPDERTARWLCLHVTFPKAGRIVLRDVGFVKSQYPIEHRGSFDCGDERIAQIVKLCLIHAAVSMSDAYVDTPGREDGQWIEDDRPRAELAARWFGDDRLRCFMIRTIAESQRDDGGLHPFPPSNYPFYPAPYDWSMQWVATLWDQYMWSGDKELVRTYWPALTKYWPHVLKNLNDDGLWITDHVLADIRVGAHPGPDMSSGIVTPWIIERLRWSADMADAIGKEQQAQAWRDTADKMAAAFRKYHIVPATPTVPAHVDDIYDPKNADGQHGYSQAGQTIAITSGLLTKDEALADINYAFAAPDGRPGPRVARWNNPTYALRTLRALAHVGLTDRAVAHLIERYSPYLPGNPRNAVPLALQGPYGGPLPEYWTSREDLRLEPGEPDTAQPKDETGSHGWGSVPLLWLHETLLGVTIAEPGGGKLRIAPQTGGLPYVSGHTVTPKGDVWVSYQPQHHRLDVTIPDGVEATLVLPPPLAECGVKIIDAPSEPQRIDNQTLRLTTGGAYCFTTK